MDWNIRIMVRIPQIPVIIRIMRRKWQKQFFQVNRYEGIRAANCTNSFMAEATREHNDANILGMGARVIGVGTALKIVDTFLNTPFSDDERHKRRIAKIEN